jgi:hypothetical protein
MDIVVSVRTFCIRRIKFDLRKGSTEWTLHIWKNYYVSLIKWNVKGKYERMVAIYKECWTDTK